MKLLFVIFFVLCSLVLSVHGEQAMRHHHRRMRRQPSSSSDMADMGMSGVAEVNIIAPTNNLPQPSFVRHGLLPPLPERYRRKAIRITDYKIVPLGKDTEAPEIMTNTIEDIKVTPTKIVKLKFSTFADPLPLFTQRLKDVIKDPTHKQNAMFNRLTEVVEAIRASATPKQVYLAAMKTLLEEVGGVNLNLDSNGHPPIGVDVDWFNLPKDKDKLEMLWARREMSMALMLVTSHRIFQLAIADSKRTVQVCTDCKERTVVTPEDLATAKVQILGSTGLLSDIDVTVDSPAASSWVAVMEDLWQETEWFVHAKWRIDIYGDFNTINKYFIDTRFVSKTALIELTTSALCSYFRNYNLEKENNDVLQHLLSWLKNQYGLLFDSNLLITDARNRLLAIPKEDKDQREIYYDLLVAAEAAKADLANLLLADAIDENEVNELTELIVVALSKANLYRFENYILPTTVIVHVIVEQGNSGPTPAEATCAVAFKQTNPRCVLGSYHYILSAIEQMGFLHHALAETHEGVVEDITEAQVCNLGATKYLGRFLRACNEASSGIYQVNSLVEPQRKYADLLRFSEALLREKKKRSDDGNTDGRCPRGNSIRQSLVSILDELFNGPVPFSVSDWPNSKFENSWLKDEAV